MRRAVLGFVAGGLLLGAVAACDTINNPPPGGGAGAATASLSPELARTKASCEAIGTIYTKNMGSFAESLSRMVTAGPDAAAARKDAQQKLRDFGTAIRQTTQGSTDVQMRADGKKAADRLQSTSSNAAFFAKIKTDQDVTNVVGPTLKGWLAPVTRHCS